MLCLMGGINVSGVANTSGSHQRALYKDQISFCHPFHNLGTIFSHLISRSQMSKNERNTYITGVQNTLNMLEKDLLGYCITTHRQLTE